MAARLPELRDAGRDTVDLDARDDDVAESSTEVAEPARYRGP
jgi:hypothetical protein